MPVTVNFHITFFNGKLNDTEFKDFPHLSSVEMGLLVDFVTKCQNGEPLPGRNKRSWVDGNGNFIPGCDGYKKSNVWHYHAGPHNGAKKCGTKNVRQENLGLHTSDAVIHYTWRGMIQKEIVVLGFSPCHDPFPSFSDKKNPVRSRSRSSGNYDDSALVDASILVGV